MVLCLLHDGQSSLLQVTLSPCRMPPLAIFCFPTCPAAPSQRAGYVSSLEKGFVTQAQPSPSPPMCLPPPGQVLCCKGFCPHRPSQGMVL